jgi:hypothetical protein
MNVYQRPLFRQMGGPVAPGMAAQEAMPDPAMAQQLQSAEQSTAANMQRVGQGYVSQTMGALDAAETPKDLIDAIRGNQMPLEARFQELAQLVGEQDAMRTPETVLALVQPTIMMTEQGAMDSGIGELMQGLVGQVDMETAGGQPTPMGQGVGSLMMAGAPAEQPMGVGQQPVANFRQGGVVQRFQTGGEASRLQQLYSEMLPTYQSILGDGGEQRRLTQAQILFDIADRAGAFAAGVDPRTGQRVQGSPAAQLAAAASGLGGQIGERLGSQEEQDRALRLAALQAAQGEYSAERAAARAAAGRSRGIGDAYEAVDAEGNVVATEFLATRDELDAFRLANEGATIRKAVAPREAVLRDVGGTLYDVTNPANPRIVIPGEGPAPVLQNVGGTLYNVTDPANPQVVVPGEGPAPVLQNVGGTLYNVTDPANPQVVVPGEGPAPVLQNVGGTLYNVTDPANPQVVVPGEGPAPVLQNVGGTLYNVTDPANPQVVIAGQPDRDIREFGGNMIDITDPANPVVVMQGQPDRDIRTVEGRVLDFTDPANPTVLYEAPAQAAAPDIRSLQIGTGPVQNFDVSTPEGAAAYRTASAQPGARVVTDSAARTADPLVSPDVMSAYAAGTLPPDEEARVQALIAENTQSVFNSQTGQFEQPTITPLVRQAEEARRTAGLSTVLAFPEEGPAPDGGAERERVLTELGGSAFGTVPFFQELANAAFAFVDANAPFPEAQEGVDAVAALNQDALIAFREATGGRTAQEAVNAFAEILPTPALIRGSPAGAASEIRQVVNLFNAQIETGQRALQTGVALPSERQRIEQGILSAQAMVRAYQALLQGIERASSGSGVDPAQFRR